MRSRAYPRRKWSPASEVSCDSCLVLTSDGVTCSAHGSNHLEQVSIIDLAPQMTHIHIDNVGDAVKALVPYVFNDHVARQNALFILHEILEQSILFGSEIDALACTPDLLSQTIQFQLSDTQRAGTVYRTPPQQCLHSH